MLHLKIQFEFLAIVIVAALNSVATSTTFAKEVSGPQVGDPLPQFTIRGVLDDEAGKTMEAVRDANGRPLVLFFIHERTRQSIALARQVLSDAANQKSAGLEAALVFLTSDVAATEDWMKIATQALPRGVPMGISPDGPTGPPTYNLNPKVIVTVIIAKDNRVIANFALTQPNLTDDAPIITSAIANALR
jgi:hypothetical protein